ncbi:methylated-DNA--[protein]-cysteine S-methyltransferase [Pseudorhodobacter sp.]|uniref:methylated-DNA--[protein]-cysteine S-methyltransferase n=1 Tax=Pseudorhodobacter sp. TaxID=1934400 RepID=UPI00264A2DE7|nr:methylated-DNA--[protein]-cysteine S-methyltransferase [Pseudorhodobacter sp.]MDN5787908.1 methylated-DNA--[protein]-cysteine S-methyltransferase [Pseudorhodobacter sp.]
MEHQAVFHSPFGPFAVVEEGGLITRIDWASRRSNPTPLLREACRQLGEYFDGKRQVFDLALDFGTGFQEQMRHAMFAIPFGETRTYGDLARLLGRPAQAIGQACGANTTPILIPCHRVLGATGLGGFSAPGGVETKVALLKLEGAAGLLI